MDTVGGEADAMLALSSSYVSLYSKIRNNSLGEQAPVPAAFRAQAAEIFEEKHVNDSHFMAKMVGLPDRYIATPPTDDDMQAVLASMARHDAKTVYFNVLDRQGDTIVRTMYPSIVTEASCANCHNRIQSPEVPWKQGDVMGAYVIERGIQDVMNSNRLFGALVGVLVSISLFSAYVVWKMQRNLIARAEQLKQLAGTDPLTGCLNRRALDNHISSVPRSGQDNAALMLLDIDHFKKVNDVHGHDVGDQVLVWFAEKVRSQLREFDVLARVGGEEFTLYLPNTSEQSARLVANRICDAVSKEELDFGTGRFQVTVSMGAVHTSRAPSQEFSVYGKVADLLLYNAKEGGRNQVVWAPGSVKT